MFLKSTKVLIEEQYYHDVPNVKTINIITISHDYIFLIC